MGLLHSASRVEPIALTGAMSTNADWAWFDGNAGNITFADNGITNATLTLWRGARDDSFDPNMQLPGLAKLTSGNNIEFCGGLTIKIPKIVNKSTNGSARWSPSGVVIGQAGVGAPVSGTLPSTGTSGAATADVAGVAFSNIASGEGFSFGVGTAGEALVGYSPSTRTLSTSIQLVAATSPQIWTPTAHRRRMF